MTRAPKTAPTAIPANVPAFDEAVVALLERSVETQTAVDVAPRMFELCPAGQFTQLAASELPNRDDHVPSGQLMHAFDEFAPYELEYVPP